MIEKTKKIVILKDFQIFAMKNFVLIFVTLCSFSAFSQDNDALVEAKRQANNFVFEGNAKIKGDDFVAAEMEYRKAISEEQSNVSGIYNLGTSYYKKGNYEESLYRLQEAANKTTDRSEKHKAFHNIGNILMKNKKCKEAVEAYKNALRNNPSDEETRYNFGLAKECAKEQEEQNKNNEDNKDDKKDQNKDNKDQDNKDQDKQDQDKKDEGDKKDQDKKDEGDQDKDKGDQEENEDGKPKDDKKDQGKGDQDKKEQPQQQKTQQGQMSPQQIKNLLEAMNNQEQKVQEKMNAEKQKGERIKTDKDW